MGEQSDHTFVEIRKVRYHVYSPVAFHIAKLESANATLTAENAKLIKGNAEIVRGVAEVERELATAHNASAELRAENARLEGRNEILEHNRRFWVSEYLSALGCETCRSERSERLTRGIAESTKGMSDDDIAELLRALDEPMSADELLTPEELENRELRAEVAALKAKPEEHQDEAPADCDHEHARCENCRWPIWTERQCAEVERDGALLYHHFHPDNETPDDCTHCQIATLKAQLAEGKGHEKVARRERQG